MTVNASGATDAGAFETAAAPWSAGCSLAGCAAQRLPQSQVSVKYVDSQETVGENAPATNVLDGNPATYWSTQWKNGTAPMPHEIQLDLGTAYPVTTVYYLPRQNVANGRIASYEVYLSTDGTTWGSPVATGTFTNSVAEQAVTFSATIARMCGSVRPASSTATPGPPLQNSTSGSSPRSRA